MSDPLVVKKAGPNRWRLVVTLPDFLGLASMVTGVLASRGASIERGRVRIEPPKASGDHASAVATFVVTSAQAQDWDAVRRDLADCAARVRAGEGAGVRADIHARLMDYLRNHEEFYTDQLYPVDLQISDEPGSPETILLVQSQDTPGFLYEMTNALSMLGINITRMNIATRNRIVRDRLWVTGEAGQKITQKSKLRAIQWAVLLMKQFTHLLPKVPDPAAALEKIAGFGGELFEREDFDEILLSLKKSHALESLSKVLGSSLFLWEEFVRLQHEPILRILGDRRLLKGRKSKAAMRRGLAARLAKVRDFAAKVSALNDFKDHEMYRIDLRHLLGKTSYLEEFAEEFSDLAEVVVEAGLRLAWRQTAQKLAAPLDAECSVLALGKFGGRELGYASDLELLFVYADAPEGSLAAAKNLRFYTELVAAFCSIIRARNEGVFQIDLRLRPYGKAGPLATSLNLFRKYYQEGGKALNFERQALLKLRAIAGSRRLGRLIERAKDEFVYAERPFDFKQAFELRERQRKELTRPGEFNAKYGTGGLLDVEYAVQTLQIVHGGEHAGDIRSANTLKALAALREADLIDAERYEALRSSYVFLRELINALRIFRGNARDLAIPDESSREFEVLSRRMGYSGTSESVRREFKRDVAFFVKRAAGLYASLMRDLENEESKQVPEIAVQPETFLWIDVGELVSGVSGEAGMKMLEACGFEDAPSAVSRLKKLLDSRASDEFREAINSSWAQWKHAADPDMALEYLTRMADASRDPRGLWRLVADSERKLSMLLTIFGSSRYLSETLIANPADWERVISGKKIDLKAAKAELARFRASQGNIRDWRKFRHRQTLLLALAEVSGLADIESVFEAFSDLGDAVFSKALTAASRGSGFKPAVLALGKWGGRGLNFSSDLDLMFLLDPPHRPLDAIHMIESVVEMLTSGGPYEFLYRVDLRLRPRGSLGSLFHSAEAAAAYYKEEADYWELQMLIKARAAAGETAIARRFLSAVRPLVFPRRLSSAAVASLRAVKRKYEKALALRGENDTNVKMGPGGIRDIEFTTQILQLRHAHADPRLATPNTFTALNQIERRGLLDPRSCEVLTEGLRFLRRIENRLQLAQNRQEFNVPRAAPELRKLAKSLAFFDTPAGRAEDRFSEELSSTKRECRSIFEKVFYGM